MGLDRSSYGIPCHTMIHSVTMVTEQEHDEALERQKKEKELRRKKEAEDSLTLEQTKDQVGPGQGFMQDQIIASHTCFGGHVDVNC